MKEEASLGQSGQGTRKTQKKRRDCLGKEILLGATGGRDKLGLGIVEENV